MKRIMFICFLIFSQLSFATPINKIIVFGDSLSDNGNLYSMTSLVHEKVPLFPVIPSNPPYFDGRFSNGPVWIEDLAQKMKINGLENYAYGGAWAESYQDSNQLFPYDLRMQVDSYLFTTPIDLSRESNLFVIWIGGNDYLYGRDNPEYATTNTVAVIKKQIETLLYYGANRFLILNLPDLGLTPNAISQGPDFANSQSQLSQLHNNKLMKMMDELKMKFPQAKLVMVDVTERFSDIINNPSKYNLKEVTKSCYVINENSNHALMNNAEIKIANEANFKIMDNPVLRNTYTPKKFFQKNNLICDNQDEYLYWDLVHPTRVAHAIMADFAFQVLQDNGLA